MNPVTAQPQAAPAPPDIRGYRDWSNSLLSCFNDCGTTAFVLFCGPCALCSMSRRLGDCCCMPMCVPGANIAMRARLRTLAGIRGSICNDCLTLAFCDMCATCQMIREMDALGL